MEIVHLHKFGFTLLELSITLILSKPFYTLKKRLFKGNISNTGNTFMHHHFVFECKLNSQFY